MGVEIPEVRITVAVANEGPADIVAELAVEPAPRGLHPGKTAFVIALPLLMACYVYVAARGVLGVAEYQPPPPYAAPVAEPNGAALYTQHCARCHGPEGQGGGLASLFLDPPPRRFGEEKFMLGTTSTGIPSDDDLAYLIKRGIPGSAMPSFETLSHEERMSLAQHIRRLAYSGLYARLFRVAAKDDEPDPADIHARTAKQLKVGDKIELPPELDNPTAVAIAHGKEIFLKTCAACHGNEGRGDGKQEMKNDNGRPTRPRDLARGIYKGGGEPDRLFARISLGMPGTPMPDLRILPPADRADVVHFVRSLANPD
ncbi:MAG TPA: c-type cytochrome [Gemmataceae bacterium]|jgi:mono/diheme cytochrome c family protein|nr:c-type cytochrome [Gemmataceae bacterium]